MITRNDAERIISCVLQAIGATNELEEQLEALMTDDDVTNPSYMQLKGAYLKSQEAKEELVKARGFAMAAREVSGR